MITTMVAILCVISLIKQTVRCNDVVQVEKTVNNIPKQQHTSRKCTNCCKRIYYGCFQKYLMERSRHSKKMGLLLKDMMNCYSRKLTCRNICRIFFKSS